VYVTSTCGHAWKDFDDWEKRMGKADTADAATNMSPYQQASWNGFYLYRSDMSLDAANRPPTPLTAVTIYVLHPGAQNEFTNAISKAIRESTEHLYTESALNRPELNYLPGR